MATDALSALFDGELTGPEMDRLLEELERSPELGRQWTRLCAIREAQAGTRITQGQRCICSDVMGRLDAEPVVNEKVVDLAVRRAATLGTRSRVAALWKPALGLAAAASVGAAAVLLVQPASQPGAGAPDQVASVPGDFRPLPVGNSDYRTVAQDDAHAAMLREYLMDHNNAIGDEGVGGTLRYARFAAYKAEYRPQLEQAP
jgi:negative regulator of sigma E activity